LEARAAHHAVARLLYQSQNARNVDIALATENNISVIRADVAGRTHGMVSYGSSGIVDPHGNVLQQRND